MQFPIAIFQQNSIYHVRIPDIPELSVTGENVADAVSNARQEVIQYLRELLAQDLSLPEPTPVSQHLTNQDYAGHTWAIVSAELSRVVGESVEVSMNLPANLYQQIIKKHPDEPLDKVMIAALKSYLTQS